nr:restriction endonuclease subunit S [Lacticaseibacillus zeae]
MVVFLQDFRVNAWEKRKLGELLTLLKDGTHGTHKKGCFAFLLSAKNVTRNKLHFDDTDRKISKKDFDEIYANYHLVQNDILVTIVGTIGRVALFPKLNVPIAFQRSVAILRPKNLLSPGFLALELQTHSVQYQLSASSNMSAQAGIYLGDLKRIIIAIPESQEQDDIANTLFHLNDLIAATQGKFDQLQMVKKALLQHLFDQSMRFKGYSDPWEKRKLGDLMKVTSVKRVHQSDWRKEGVPFLRARDIIAFNKGQKIKEPIYISESQYEKYVKQSGRVTPGDLLVTGVGSIGVPFVVKAKTPLYFKDGNIIWFQNKTLDPDFLFYQFTSASVQSFVMSSSGKGTVGTFTISSGKRTPIVFPVMSEQRRIGMTLRNISNLIAATQSKLSSLESLKKALLQGLFI